MELQELLSYFPQTAKFVSVKDKNPGILGHGWQKKAVIRDEAIAHLESNPKANGLGCMCGSGGLVFIDHDGASVDELIEEITGLPITQALPTTLTISSGTPGHYQKVYYCSVVDSMKSTQQTTGVKSYNETKGKDEEEQLDIRCSSGQSVIWGQHPSGRKYEVVDDSAIAPCPDWIINFALKDKPKERQEAPPLLKQSNGPDLNFPQTDLDWAHLYLPHIDPTPMDWYQWRDATMALHAVGFSESEARAWSAQSTKHTDKGFTAVWKHIKGNPGPGIAWLGARAKEGGWESPFKGRGESFTRSPQTPKKVVNHPAWDKRQADEDLDKLNSLLDQLLKEVDRTDPSVIKRQLSELQASYSHVNRDILGTFEEMKRHKWATEEEELAETDLDFLEQAKQYQRHFDFTSVFPEKLGDRVNGYVNQLKCTQGIPFSAILGSLGIFTGSKISIRKGKSQEQDISWLFGKSKGSRKASSGGQKEYCNPWMDIDGYPSTMKTAGQHPVTRAREAMQEKEDEAWDAIQEQVNNMRREWDGLSDDEKKRAKGDCSVDPDAFAAKNKLRQYTLKNDITPAQRVNRISEQPRNSGVGLVADEIGQIFGNLDQYAKGTNTRSYMLSWWNRPLSGSDGRDRAGDGLKSYEKQLINVLVNSQPKTTKRFIGGADTSVDADGLSSRLDYCWADFEEGYEDPKDVSDECWVDIAKVFRILELMPDDVCFRLSPDAIALLDEEETKVKTLTKDAAYSNQAFSAYLGKFGTKILRYTLALQLLHICDEFIDLLGETPPEEMPALESEIRGAIYKAAIKGIQWDMVDKAIAMGRYYISSFRMIQHRLNESDGHNKDTPIPDIHLSLINFFEKHPNTPYKPYQVKKACAAVKKYSADRLQRVLNRMFKLDRVEMTENGAFFVTKVMNGDKKISPQSKPDSVKVSEKSKNKIGDKISPQSKPDSVKVSAKKNQKFCFKTKTIFFQPPNPEKEVVETEIKTDLHISQNSQKLNPETPTPQGLDLGDKVSPKPESENPEIPTPQGLDLGDAKRQHWSPPDSKFSVGFSVSAWVYVGDRIPENKRKVPGVITTPRNESGEYGVRLYLDGQWWDYSLSSDCLSFREEEEEKDAS